MKPTLSLLLYMLILSFSRAWEQKKTPKAVEIQHKKNSMDPLTPETFYSCNMWGGTVCVEKYRIDEDKDHYWFRNYTASNAMKYDTDDKKDMLDWMWCNAHVGYIHDFEKRHYERMQLFKSEVIRGEKKWFFEIENEDEMPNEEMEDEDDDEDGDDDEEQNNFEQFHKLQK